MSGLLFTLAIVLGYPTRRPVPAYRAVLDTGFRFPDSIQLTWVSDFKVGPDHSLFIAERTPSTLYYVPATGSRVAVIMGTGAGPGESRAIWSLGWRSDSLVVMDGALQRLTFLGPDGKLLRTEPSLERCTAPGWAILADGRCLATVTTPERPGAPPAWARLVAQAYGRLTTDTLTSLPLEHALMRFRFRDGALSLQQPFADTPITPVAPDGTAIVEVARAAASGNQASFGLRRWTPTTGWTAWVTFSYTPRPVLRREIDSLLDRLAQPPKTGPSGYQPRREDIASQLYTPKYFPAAEQALIGRDGSIWIGLNVRRASTEPPNELEWRVFSKQLVQERTVHIPAGLRLLEADGDTIWGMLKNGDDVPALSRYSLTPIR